MIMLTELAAADFSAYKNQIDAQITVESAWNPQACSAYACGLSQFTSYTWRSISPLTNPSCKGVSRNDPSCSIRSQILLMRRLLRRYSEAHSDRQRWMFSWAAYDAGSGWIGKEINRCRETKGCDHTKWEGNVENVCLQGPSACKESREYPRRILREIEKLSGN